MDQGAGSSRSLDLPMWMDSNSCWINTYRLWLHSYLHASPLSGNLEVSCMLLQPRLRARFSSPDRQIHPSPASLCFPGHPTQRDQIAAAQEMDAVLPTPLLVPLPCAAEVLAASFLATALALARATHLPLPDLLVHDMPSIQVFGEKSETSKPVDGDDEDGNDDGDGEEDGDVGEGDDEPSEEDGEGYENPNNNSGKKAPGGGAGGEENGEDDDEDAEDPEDGDDDDDDEEDEDEDDGGEDEEEGVEDDEENEDEEEDDEEEELQPPKKRKK
ncbi:hypothetical protein OPV22_021056 [Ensete ventricosum]|uniref:Uncharacterized protein n=1 Tax=Ensete ventricosum TaxID=4639 RepID=A0AAV8QL61_ENSVE|nr:hypothetical protein OPV22_021056 [Ensete ventricosum]